VDSGDKPTLFNTASALTGNITLRSNTLVTHTQGTVKTEREMTMKMPGNQSSNNCVLVSPVNPIVKPFDTAKKYLAPNS